MDVVVISAYNERAYIEQTVLDWLRLLDKLDGRLIAVGDGSKDSTGVILDRLAEKEPRLLVHHQQNAGHGAAILAGYRMAIIHCCYLIQPSRHGLKHLFRCALG